MTMSDTCKNRLNFHIIQLLVNNFHNKNYSEMIPCLSDNIALEQRNLEDEIQGNQEIEYENQSVGNVLCGDLYIIGRLWIEALKTVLVGAKFSLFPIVEAAKVDYVPQKPPRMKYTELPLYKSPHHEYKDYLEDKRKCPDAKVKLVHESLLPYVKCYRQAIEQNFCEARCFIHENLLNICDKIRRVKKDFKQTMRDSDNLAVRQATVLFGGTAGYFLGSGGGVPRRIFFTSLGFLSAGALCFPKETDEVFRDVAYSTGKVFIAVYNKWCGKDFVLREKLACRDDLSASPPSRKPVQCPPNK